MGNIIGLERQLVELCYTDDPGKPEVPVVVYKVGECMQELIKLWKEYESSHPDKSGDFASNGPTLEVRIPAEHVTATNRQVRRKYIQNSLIIFLLFFFKMT